MECWLHGQVSCKPIWPSHVVVQGVRRPRVYVPCDTCSAQCAAAAARLPVLLPTRGYSRRSRSDEVRFTTCFLHLVWSFQA